MSVFDDLTETIGRTDADQIGKIAAADRVMDAFVVIPKTELPEVKPSPNDRTTFYVNGTNAVFTSAKNARDWALVDIAVWLRMEAREADEEATKVAAEKLRVRRDELASEFTAVNSYSGQLPYTQKLIDRIIELEGE